ncbi:hypothetical protein CPB97_004807, partial [Podila verticillata]
MNIKKMVALLKVHAEPIHSAWTRDGFDFPYTGGAMEQMLDYISVQEMLGDAQDMMKLQEQFLEMNTMDVEDDEEEVQTHKR